MASVIQGYGGSLLGQGYNLDLAYVASGGYSTLTVTDNYSTLFSSYYGVPNNSGFLSLVPRDDSYACTNSGNFPFVIPNGTPYKFPNYPTATYPFSFNSRLGSIPLNGTISTGDFFSMYPLGCKMNFTVVPNISVVPVPFNYYPHSPGNSTFPPFNGKINVNDIISFVLPGNQLNWSMNLIIKSPTNSGLYYDLLPTKTSDGNSAFLYKTLSAGQYAFTFINNLNWTTSITVTVSSLLGQSNYGKLIKRKH